MSEAPTIAQTARARLKALRYSTTDVACAKTQRHPQRALGEIHFDPVSSSIPYSLFFLVKMNAIRNRPIHALLHGRYYLAMRPPCILVCELPAALLIRLEEINRSRPVISVAAHIKQFCEEPQPIWVMRRPLLQ